MPRFGKWLSKELQEKGISRWKLAKDLHTGTNMNSVYEYCKGTKLPSKSTLYTIFDILRTPENERELVETCIRYDEACIRWDSARKKYLSEQEKFMKAFNESSTDLQSKFK